MSQKLLVLYLGDALQMFSELKKMFVLFSGKPSFYFLCSDVVSPIDANLKLVCTERIILFVSL